MSTDATAAKNSDSQTTQLSTEQMASDKGKGKSKAPAEDVSMGEEEDDEDSEEEENENEQSSDEEDEEDDMEEIDPSAIMTSSRRTRGVKVDYTSKEALEKAGLDKEEDDDDDDDDVKMKD